MEESGARGGTAAVALRLRRRGPQALLLLIRRIRRDDMAKRHASIQLR